LRAGTFQGKARSQTQVAVTDGQQYLLLNASPDLRSQIEATPLLHPRSGQRDSPISAVVLTSADIDQVAGLLSLRELQPLTIYSTPSIRRILQQDNSLFAMLNRVPKQVSWQEIAPGRSFAVLDNQATDSGIRCEPFSLATHFPAYVSAQRSATLKPEEALLGLFLESSSGKKFVYAPAVPAIDGTLLQRLESADLLLFDGTFWSDDELIRPRKVFIHINNTNPMLDESGPQYRQVREAGWEIAEDKSSLDL